MEKVRADRPGVGKDIRQLNPGRNVSGKRALETALVRESVGPAGPCGGRTVGPARRVAAPGLECIDRLTCPVMTRAPLPQTCRGTKASVKILLTYDKNGAILKRKERGRSHGAAGKTEKGMRAASCGGVPA